MDFEERLTKITHMYNEKIEGLKKEIEECKKMLDRAMEMNYIEKIQFYKNKIHRKEQEIIYYKEKLDIIRLDTQQDINERLHIQREFSRQVASVIPDGIDMLFHGNKDLNTIHEIITSGGLKTLEEQETEQHTGSFAENLIDVSNKYNIQVPVEFSEPGIMSCRPYGAIFVVYPSEEEKDRAIENNGTEIRGGIKSIDFKLEDNRFVGIITTHENKKIIKKWLEENEMDYKKVYTHSEFIDMCKRKFNVQNKAEESYESER